MTAHPISSAASERFATGDVSAVACDPSGFLRHLFDCAVQRALPGPNTQAFLPPPPTRGRTLVLGAGKAGGAMAHAVEALWPAHVAAHPGASAAISGLVVTRYGHTPERPAGVTPCIEIVEASHPVPDAAGLAAAERILALTQGLTEDDLVLCLISGGGSSLLTLPAHGVSLEEKQAVHRALLASGADIAQMNCVRRHLSRIKGGWLARACGAARVVTLAISDVPGDDLAVIASGPTVADGSTCADALAILDRYQIALSDTARAGLESGRFETPKFAPGALARHSWHLIATPQQSLQAAAAAARAAGLNAHVLSDEMEGESREVGKVQAAIARAVAHGNGAFVKPCVVLSGGETTVTVRPRREGAARGRGGRAGEFCLGLAQALQGQSGVWGLAADTDGIDGVEDNAGALVRPDTLARARELGLNVADHLDRNDAYGYFSGLGDLVVSGPTHTNVNDFRALLIL